MKARERLGTWRRVAGFFLVLILLTAPRAYASEKVGVAAGVVGVVEIASEFRNQPVQAASGLELLLRDRLASSEAAHMQAVLLDRTTLTLGPNSVLVIDELVFDPTTRSGKLSATFSKGMLQYISGDIAKSEAENITIVTPVGTVKVTGTSVFIIEDSETGSLFVGLLGPALTNNADLAPGGIVFHNEWGSTRILRSGYGLFVSQAAAPGPAVRTPPRLTSRLQQGLTSLPAAESAPSAATTVGPENASVAAGQNLADIRADAFKTARVLELVREREELIMEAPEYSEIGRPDTFFSYKTSH